MKTIKTACTLLILILICSSCQNSNKKNMIAQAPPFEIEWEESINAPLGYPVDVFKGGLTSSYMTTSLYLGTTFGPWGKQGAGMSRSKKPLPTGLDVSWLSYAENKFYHIKSEIDSEKMAKLFKEGFSSKGADGTLMKKEYDHIIVGFAPGGVVIVWVSGSGKQVEIGRYEGNEITFSEKTIKALDSHEHLLFELEYRKSIMDNELIVPKAIKEANRDKPIPLGLWDSYRKKYSWKPIFASNEKIKMDGDLRVEMVNGEYFHVFEDLETKNDYEERAIPKKVTFGWWDVNGQGYGGSVIFKEKEILEAFSKIYSENKTGNSEIEFLINATNTFLAVKIKGNGKEIGLKENEVEVFKSRSVTQKFKKE